MAENDDETIEISIGKIPPTQEFDAVELINEITKALLRAFGGASKDCEFSCAVIECPEQQWQVTVHAKDHESMDQRALSTLGKKADEHELEFVRWAIDELLRPYPTLNSWNRVTIAREPQARITVILNRVSGAEEAA